MHLSDHSLRQLDEAYLRSLDLEALRYLSARLLADLKEARARLDARSAGRSRSPKRPAPSEYARNRAALAEFIETCRQRGQDPWRVLERAIADRRAGRPYPPWPR
jgi:transposase